MEEAIKAKIAQLDREEMGEEIEEPEPWPVSDSPEDTITIYGALRTYLKILSQQPEEDLETIARVTRLMIAIKPQAVEASQEITRAAVKD